MFLQSSHIYMYIFYLMFGHFRQFPSGLDHYLSIIEKWS